MYPAPATASATERQRAGKPQPPQAVDFVALEAEIAAAFESAEGPLVRLQLPVSATDPLAWLSGIHARRRFFWADRTGRRRRAAAGVADRIDGHAALARLRERLKALAIGAIDGGYFGGMRFDPAGSIDPEWCPFGIAQFVLPRCELIADDGQPPTLAVNIAVDHDSPSQVLDEIREMTGAPPVSPLHPRVISRVDLPARSDWDSLVRAALARIDAGKLDKVVLARRSTFRCDARVDPVDALRLLTMVARRSFTFLFDLGDDGAFLGASPERLYRLSGGELHSEALAGTRPRSRNPSTDQTLRAELTGSTKDIAEHAYVVEFVHGVLRELGHDVQQDPPSVMDLASNRHLQTRMRGRIGSTVDAVDALKRLHPTPAVGGQPFAEACRFIRDNEAFDRGWYAGPVGWIGAESAEFAVGIRSGLLRQEDGMSVLDLYAGAGIVPGSDPGDEWGEVENKLADFVAALSLDGGAE